MALIKENSCICITCDGIIRFCTSDENQKRRHVAIVHGKETFSSLRCGKCQRKYYDMDHFTEHLETSQECSKDSWMIKREPLSAHLEMAFAALVEQMMRPVETDQTEKAPIRNGEGKMDRKSGETWKRSMDAAKRKRTESVGDIAPNSVKRSNDADGSDGCATGKTTAAGDDPDSVNEQFKIRSSTVRRQYCLHLIDNFATAGKLQCQQCSAKFAVVHRENAKIVAHPIVQHALGHLKKPIYHCRICNITKFTSNAIHFHIRRYHSGSEEGYEECADQYHQQIMDMLGQCFDSHKDEGGQVPATPVHMAEDKCVDDHFKLRPEVVRREYCMDLIDKFPSAGKLQCQLCSAECAVIQGKNTKSKLTTTPIIQHALGHLKKPIYHCRICNTTKFTLKAVYSHIRWCHPTSDEGYEDRADQYHQDIMNMLGQCFHMEKNKHPVGQVEKKLAIPGRCYTYYDTRSPLYNERLHYVRRLAACYPNQTRILCQLCSKMCTVSGVDRNMSIRNHAMVHLNKDIFQCILCGRYCKFYFSLKHHMHKEHQQESMEGAYMDYTDKYHQEFVDMLGKCFDPDSGNGVVKSKKKAGSGMSGSPSKNALAGNGKTSCGTDQGF